MELPDPETTPLPGSTMETEHTTCSGKRLDSDLDNRKTPHGAKDTQSMECEQEVTSDAETTIYEPQATCELHVHLTHSTDTELEKYNVKSTNKAKDPHKIKQTKRMAKDICRPAILRKDKSGPRPEFTFATYKLTQKVK